MRRHPLDSLRIMSTFVVVMVCFICFPPASLLAQKAMSSHALAFLFLLPATMALLLAPIVALLDRRLAHPLLTVMSSTSEGIALGIGFTGLVMIYFWYADPAASHLEPLTLLFAAITGAAVVSQKRILKIQTLLAERISSGSK